MIQLSTPLIVSLVMQTVPLVAQDDTWTRVLSDRAKRGTLHDRLQYVRGDSGKWNDQARLQHARPIEQMPANVLLDDWSDQLLENKFQLTSNDDNWLLFRTRQLDDKDRVWVERIERRGNQFRVVLHQAIWQGRYAKNFTYYNVFGVNLGKLEPGQYEAKWIVKPLAFDKFEQPGSPSNNWPNDERPAAEQPTELSVEFTVVTAP